MAAVEEQIVITDETRVILRNVIYITNIPSPLATEKLLSSEKYFGQFGGIQIVCVSKSDINDYQNSANCTDSAYIQYYAANPAINAIQCFNNYQFPSFPQLPPLKVNYAVNKFCEYYRNNKECSMPNCRYIHYEPHTKDIVTQHEIDQYYGVQSQNSSEYLSMSPSSNRSTNIKTFSVSNSLKMSNQIILEQENDKLRKQIFGVNNINPLMNVKQHKMESIMSKNEIFQLKKHGSSLEAQRNGIVRTNSLKSQIAIDCDQKTETMPNSLSKLTDSQTSARMDNKSTDSLSDGYHSGFKTDAKHNDTQSMYIPFVYIHLFVYLCTF